MSTAPSRTAHPSPGAAMSLLSRGVPLSLLLDLALGPNSRELMETERPVPRPRPAA